MFYMNNSNLLIRITELSTEKVSNWIQATRTGARRKTQTQLCTHAFRQRSRSEIEHPRDKELHRICAKSGFLRGLER